MPRAIWSGSITFGLVSIPVKLFSALSPKEVHFHQLHDADGGRIHQRRVCSVDGEEVPYEHIVKGYDLGGGRYGVVTREELEALDPEATRSIDIEDFVDLSQIDPLYYASTYYLAPDRGAARPYALLRAAMERTGKVGIARMVMRTKQHLCAVRPLGRALGMATLNYADEVVPQEEVEGLDALPPPPARELEIAEQLIDSRATAFQPERYRDEHRERVLELIRRKAEGQGVAPAAAEAPPPPVVNLMDALRKSLAAAQAGKGAGEAERPGGAEVRTGARRHQAKAARTGRPGGTGSRPAPASGKKRPGGEGSQR